MQQIFFRKSSVSFLFICSVNFPFMTSRATGTGLLVKMTLTSKDIKGSSGVTLCSFRDLTNPLLSMINEVSLSEYS